MDMLSGYHVGCAALAYWWILAFFMLWFIVPSKHGLSVLRSEGVLARTPFHRLPCPYLTLISALNRALSKTGPRS